MHDDSDDILLAHFANPDTRDDAFRRLMKRYGRDLYWHIRRIVVDHDDAEDALQETAISALKHLPRYRGDSSLSTWLYRIATNEALQLLRRRTRWYQGVDSLNESLAEKIAAPAYFDGDHAAILFQKALLQLPTQQRIAFNLRYYDGLPYEQIARITGKSVATLKANYHHAVKRIENFIKENAS